MEKWISVEECEPERGKQYFIKGLKGAYYAGEYCGLGIDGKHIFWVRSGSMFVKAKYYVNIPE
jgi:hypothetical protein